MKRIEDIEKVFHLALSSFAGIQKKQGKCEKRIGLQGCGVHDDRNHRDAHRQSACGNGVEKAQRGILRWLGPAEKTCENGEHAPPEAVFDIKNQIEKIRCRNDGAEQRRKKELLHD